MPAMLVVAVLIVGIVACAALYACIVVAGRNDDDRR